MIPILPQFRRRTAASLLALFALLAAACQRGPSAETDAASAALPELSITVFAAPSQSLWLPTLIQELQLDHKHGFRLKVTPKPGQVAYTDFASGADPVCFCAAPSAVARFVEQGSDITLLWNVFNLDYFIVTRDPSIRTLADLQGKRLSADTGTGSWAVAAWLLQQNGVDLDKVQVRSVSNPTAAVTELSLGRIDAMHAGLINLATLQTDPAADKGYRVLDLNQKTVLGRLEAAPNLPSITFGVWRPWLAKPGNRELAKAFYRANLEAAAWLRSHPEEAAKIVAKRTSMPEPALLHLFKTRPDMIDIRPISEYRGAIALLTQDLLPKAGQLERPLTDAELSAYVSDFTP